MQGDRASTERLLLRLAIGAATERLWLSYPRLDVAGARPRVPSFYVLDVMRAITGHIPEHESLQRQALAAGGARTRVAGARSARRDAIDDVEHDLATLRRADRGAGPRSGSRPRALSASAQRRAAPVGHRAVGARARPLDAAGRPGPGHAGDASRCWTRSGSARARTRSRRSRSSRPAPISSCCRRSTGSQPNDEPEPLQRLDPLTRGALFHEVQAEFFRSMQAHGRLPLDGGRRTARRSAGSIGRWPTSRRPTASGWRRPSNGSGGRRSPRSAATSACGCGGCRTLASGARRISSSASACRTKGAIRAASASR